MAQRKDDEKSISEIASEGGRARKESLSPADRREIARQAVEARWERQGKLKVLRATHGSPDRPLRIGEIEIPCYVLNDGRRVIVQRGMLTALDMSQGTASATGGGDRLTKFFSGKSVSPFVPTDLKDVITNAIRFRVPSGGEAYGYEATILADICEAVLEARRQGKLNYQQEHIADRCEILVRAFAKTGIVALVDEATGFQEARARDALAEILEQFISEELRRWVKTFPLAYFKELCRLRRVPFSHEMRFPAYFGHLTNDLIYSRLAPGVLEELRRKNPAEDGRRKHRHHQYLTGDVGHPKLLQHLGSVVTLMRLSSTWDDLMEKVNKIHPVPIPAPLFDHLEDDDD